MIRTSTDLVPKPGSALQAVAGMEVEVLDDGMVIYRREPQEVHHLNAIAAFVYLHCEGSLDVVGLTEEIRSAFEGTNVWRAVIESCVTQLTAAGLITAITNHEERP